MHFLPFTRPLAVAIACLVLLLARAEPASATPLRFGIVPQQSASRLAETWDPLLHHVAERSGVELAFVTAKDIPTFEACLAKGAYDIAYMNPYHYTVFHARAGYEAFARQAGARLQGILVASRDGPVRRIEDIDGVEIAFPSPAAFGASVLPQAELRRRGIAFVPRYVKSHDSVYRAVEMGLVPVGGGILRTFEAVDPGVRAGLEIIYRTEKYPPHAFAALPTVPARALAAVREALLGLGREAPGLLAPLGFAGIEAGQDADWDPVRALDIRPAGTEIVIEDSGACHSG